jgi:hypothetical protein
VILGMDLGGAWLILSVVGFGADRRWSRSASACSAHCSTTHGATPFATAEHRSGNVRPGQGRIS